MDSEASSTVATQDAHSWNRYSATSPTTPSNPDQSVAGPSRPTTQFEIQTFPWNSIARYVPTTAPPRDNSYEAQGLGKLSDGPDGPQGKAPYSWTVLITHAIMGSPDRRLTLAAIYEAIETRYPWYKTQGTGWKNSIRHALSLNRCFKKQDRTVLEPGKGKYWIVDQGEEPGYTRPRRKRNRRSANFSTDSGMSETSTLDGHSIDSPLTDYDSLSVAPTPVDSPLFTPPTHTPCSSETQPASPAESSASGRHSYSSSPLVTASSIFPKPLTILFETPQEFPLGHRPETYRRIEQHDAPSELTFVAEKPADPPAPRPRTKIRGKRKAPPATFKVDLQPTTPVFSPEMASYEVIADSILAMFTADSGILLRDGLTQGWTGLSSKGFLTQEDDTVPPGLTYVQASLISRSAMQINHMHPNHVPKLPEDTRLALHAWFKLLWSASDPTMIGLEYSNTSIRSLQGFGIQLPISLKSKLQHVCEVNRSTFHHAMEEQGQKEAFCSQTLCYHRDTLFPIYHTKVAIPLIYSLINAGTFLHLSSDGQLAVANCVRRIHWDLWTTECARELASAEVEYADSQLGIGQLDREVRKQMEERLSLPKMWEARQEDVERMAELMRERDEADAAAVASGSGTRSRGDPVVEGGTSPSSSPAQGGSPVQPLTQVSSSPISKRSVSPPAPLYAPAQWDQTQTQTSQLPMTDGPEGRYRLMPVQTQFHDRGVLMEDDEDGDAASEVSSLHDDDMGVDDRDVSEVKMEVQVEEDMPPSPVQPPRTLSSQAHPPLPPSPIGQTSYMQAVAARAPPSQPTPTRTPRPPPEQVNFSGFANYIPDEKFAKGFGQINGPPKPPSYTRTVAGPPTFTGFIARAEPGEPRSRSSSIPLTTPPTEPSPNNTSYMPTVPLPGASVPPEQVPLPRPPKRGRPSAPVVVPPTKSRAIAPAPLAESGHGPGAGPQKQAVLGAGKKKEKAQVESAPTIGGMFGVLTTSPGSRARAQATSSAFFATPSQASVPTGPPDSSPTPTPMPIPASSAPSFQERLTSHRVASSSSSHPPSSWVPPRVVSPPPRQSQPHPPSSFPRRVVSSPGPRSNSSSGSGHAPWHSYTQSYSHNRPISRSQSRSPYSTYSRSPSPSVGRPTSPLTRAMSPRSPPMRMRSPSIQTPTSPLRYQIDFGDEMNMEARAGPAAELERERERDERGVVGEEEPQNRISRLESENKELWDRIRRLETLAFVQGHSNQSSPHSREQSEMDVVESRTGSASASASGGRRGSDASVGTVGTSVSGGVSANGSGSGSGERRSLLDSRVLPPLVLDPMMGMAGYRGSGQSSPYFFAASNSNPGSHYGSHSRSQSYSHPRQVLPSAERVDTRDRDASEEELR